MVFDYDLRHSIHHDASILSTSILIYKRILDLTINICGKSANSVSFFYTTIDHMIIQYENPFLKRK